jgi:hypothetical protein
MKTRNFFSITAAIIALMFFLVLLCRNYILSFAVAHFAGKIESRFNVKLTTGQIAFDGLRTIHLSDISLVPQSGDTLLRVGSINVNPSYLKLLLGKLSYHKLIIDNVKIRMISDSTGNNFSSTKPGAADTVKIEGQHNKPEYGARLNVLYSRILELVTGETQVNDFLVEYRSPSNYRRYSIPDFRSDGNVYSCNVYNLSQKDTISWAVSGNVLKEENGFDFKMIRESKPSSMVSLTGGEKSFKWLVDTLYFETYSRSYHDGIMTLSFKGSFNNLQINYWRISPGDVSILTGDLDMIVKAGSDFFSSDTSSTIALNSFKSHVSFGYDLNGPQYSLKIFTGQVPASSLFESFPHGMFDNLQGMKTKGDIKYTLDFSINKADPDNLIFESELKKYNFSIIRFGNDYIPRINEEFLYTAYDGDRPVRTFPVGPSNPDFTPYDQISSFLKSAVMTSEDGSFMLHGGFNEEAFRQSIATNVKQGRFARGGSTISMQLVKNVYLSRNKTISRKLEEALIVWLIEKNRLVSKERMFEVYLNIIEWGPDIYGIKEASEFYFSKLPSQLTLAESIFLASIIPHPKYFKYSFDQNGQLKPFLNGYYKLVTDRMLRKNWISPLDTFSLRPFVQLTGPALQFIMPADAVPSDSLSTEDDFIN